MDKPPPVPLCLPPEHLFTCTVGRNRSQARCAGLPNTAVQTNLVQANRTLYVLLGDDFWCPLGVSLGEDFLSFEGLHRVVVE